MLYIKLFFMAALDLLTNPAVVICALIAYVAKAATFTLFGWVVILHGFKLFLVLIGFYIVFRLVLLGLILLGGFMYSLFKSRKK